MGGDLSMTASGLCLPSGQCVTIRPRLKGDLRLGEIRRAWNYYLGSGIREAAPDLCVLERVPNSKQGGFTTTETLLLVHGIVRDELAQAGVPYAYIPATVLKKYAVGSGAADKRMMIHGAIEYGAGTNPLADAALTDNEADAWWLRAAGLHYYDQPISPQHILSRDLLFGLNSQGKPRVVWPDRSTPTARKRSSRAT
jgi:Holliday junction resolvasome RuvABC endonuclease subunit